ncbi:hypothetical protein EV646_101243 [Kribbella antiqua]|uniref:Uncharacterized protein n=1 Tax=Kribbella antiqua TaxID=2512217 RepID=A0A4V2S597_9ACTN|nr:hypothetical protein [Kribbella antiqua]TCO51260.1 hypothetical protein EV646_101243 [Kribbella antiqua]
MKKAVLIALGALLTATGGIWTLQGLGYLKGSSMTGSSFWAMVGPIVAGLGVVTFRGPQRR